MPLRGYRPAPYIFRKIFSRATFASQIVCLCLETLRSYLTSKLTMLEKYSKFNIFGLLGKSQGGAIPQTIHFIFTSNICLADSIMPLSSTVKKSKLMMLEKCNIGLMGGRPWGTTAPCFIF